MKRSPMPRRTSYMKRGGRVNPVNKERAAKRAAVVWPQRDRCRTLPCCACGKPGPSDPAHIRTRASLAGAPPKIVDRENVAPLCRVCHTIQGTMPIRQFNEEKMPGGTTMESVAVEIREQLEGEGVSWA